MTAPNRNARRHAPRWLYHPGVQLSVVVICTMVGGLAFPTGHVVLGIAVVLALVAYMVYLETHSTGDWV